VLKTQRAVKIKGKDGFESNAEHSYQLALVCWYLIDAYNLKLNRQIVFEYALAHDLVEVYAGDTDPHKHSKEFIASKEIREKAAFEKIEKEFSGFKKLLQTIEQYEKKTDEESRFVYLIDKIMPVINTYLAGDSYYKENSVSFDKWKNWLNKKRSGVSFNEESTNKLLDELVDFLKSNQEKVFE